jgi:anti-anti-sigma regulatory factor
VPLPGCKILALIEPPTAIIKIVGRAAAESARDFQHLIRRLQADGMTRFVLDLSGCLLMDSTFSGVLAGLATEMGPTPGDDWQHFTIVGANARVLDLLDNLGVLPLVDVLEGGPSDKTLAECQEIALGQHSKAEMTACCLEAHRLLMKLKPENAAKFRTVTEILEQQLSAAA